MDRELFTNKYTVDLKANDVAEMNMDSQRVFLIYFKGFIFKRILF